MRTIGEIMRLAPVIPVLVIEEAADARAIAGALVAGGLRVLEVTLRTALDAIAEIRKIEGAVVGAGTVLGVRQLEESLAAGAEFVVSPGLTEPLGRAAIAAGAPFLPGIATAADLMRGLDLGLKHFKFFPAETSGGIPALKALAGPFGGRASARPVGSPRRRHRRGSRSIPCYAWGAPGWCRRDKSMSPRSRETPARPPRCAPDPKRRPLRLLPLLFLASACAAGPPALREADLSRELAGRTAGAPQDCVAASPGANLVGRDAQTLVYRRGDTIWVNRLAAACPGLDPMSRLIIDVHGSQYCRGDRIQAIEPGRTIPGPTCLFGPFTPYKR